MTIKQRFENCTKEELKNGIKNIEDHIKQDEEFMEYFKNNNMTEFFNMTKESHDGLVERLIDTRCALALRK